MNNFAKFISVVLSPGLILLPVPYILVMKTTNDFVYALKWTFFSYIFVLELALLVVLGVIFGFFTNFDVSKKEQRPLLFLFSAFTMLCYISFLYIFNGPKILFVAVVSLILGLIFIAITTKWIKASIHVATVTSFLLLISIIYGQYYFLLLLLVPLLAWSRVKTKKHTPMETMVGCVLGILLTVIVYTISKYYLLDLFL